MRFFCLLPVRDEADIIGPCLRELTKWADKIVVFDNGSVDETWDVVQDWAQKDKRIVPLRKDAVYFSDTLLRGWIFHQARKQMRNGDWFLRVDADEIHHIPPPEFVRTRLQRHETIVWHQYYDFRLTQSEVKAWEEGRESLRDRQRPIEERRRWYTASAYSEPRLCRYRETMRWPAAVSFPYNSGFVARERLPIRHYPHRDPVQLNRRCRLRAIMHAAPTWDPGTGGHWREAEWRRFITPDDEPALRYWPPGTPLPEVRQTNHLPPAHKRAVQRLVHALALPLLDRLRPDWKEATYPDKIPAEIVQRLARELAADDSDSARLCT